MELREDRLEARLGTKCEAAKLAWEDAHQWVQRFTFLVWLMAAAVVLTLIVALVLLFVSENRAGAIGAGAGTLVTGTAMGFVIKQLGEAKRREDTMRRIMDRVCVD